MVGCFDDILNRLLAAEHSAIAYKLGFSNAAQEALPFDDVCEAIKALNQLSLEKSENSRNMFITVAALLWEYASENYPNLRAVLIQLLSRIGYAPSSVILDKSYGVDNKFEPLHSLFAQLSTGLNQKAYEIEVGSNKELLTGFQLSVSNSIRNNNIVGISAPTSAGKSYVLLMEAARAVIENNWDVIYIVPTISLINQVTLDFIEYFKKLDVTDVEIFNSYNPELVTTERPHVFVLTQERAAAAFAMSEKPFRPSLLIIDEIQNIERITSGDAEMRSKILLDMIYEFRFSDNVEKIVLSGARISRIDTLSKELLGDECVGITTDISPVLNLTYSIAKNKEQYYLKQYCSLLEAPQSIPITGSLPVEGHGKKLYNDAYLSYLSNIVKRLGNDSQNIIFAPRPTTARKAALALVGNDESNDSLNSLAEYLKETVRDNYVLADIVVKGVAYHHGKLPQHVRKVIEYAISKKILSNIVCTTTLMQGVNMPAQNVIVRNPHLYVRKQGEGQELTSYEMANLRGRAGRLLKDFIGRTFVLDENAFLQVSEEYTEETLFEDTYKELESSYRSVYDKHSLDIDAAVAGKTPATQLPKEYSFIVTHIRQAILRHGEDAQKRLAQIGIVKSDSDFEIYKEALAELQVPHEICLKNRYTDPIILDSLYLDNEVPTLPTRPTEREAGAQLSEVLKYLRDNPSYTNLYEERIPSSHRKGTTRSILCDMSIKWARQKTLKEILQADHFNDPEKVEDAIELLQKTISYDLPMLLKPIYDVKQIEPVFITFLEAGAYQPLARKLIEIGIPRETAIYLYNAYFTNFKYDSEDLYATISTTLRSRQHEIPFWAKIQLASIL